MKPEDKGLYTCVASNSAGTRKSIAAQLTVQGSFTTDDFYQDKHIIYTHAMFTCLILCLIEN